MIKNVLENISVGTIYYGLEICEVNGTELFYLVELKKSTNELHISRTVTIESWEGLSKQFKKNIPVFLTINTSNVLIKKLDDEFVDTNPDAVINHAYPNLDLDTFYYEIIQLSGHPIISISKKEYVDNILQKLSEHKIDIAQFSLGISSLSGIIGYLGKESSITVSNLHIEIQDHQIISIAAMGDNRLTYYEINGLKILNTHLLGFSNVISWLGNMVSFSNFSDKSKNLKQEFLNKRKFYILSRFSLVFFLTVLLANFFAFDYYFSKVQKMNATIEINKQRKNSLASLDASVKIKEARVTILTTLSNSKSTFYLDWIASNLPITILLDELTYQPLIKPMRDNDPILLSANILSVSGTSSNGKEFSDWIEELEKLKWVISVETINYDYSSKSVSTFSIKIGTHEE